LTPMAPSVSRVAVVAAASACLCSAEGLPPTDATQKLLSLGECAQEKDFYKKAECLFYDLYVGTSGALPSKPTSPHGDDAEAIDTYGEVTPEGVAMMLKSIPTGNLMNKDDVFVDLGSGLGKLATQVFLTTPCKKAVGIELADFRHGQAQQAMVKLQRKGTEAEVGSKLASGDAHVSFTLEDRELRLEKADLLSVDLKEATIILVSNLAFPPALSKAVYRKLVATAKPGTLIVTLAKIEGCTRGLYMLGKASLKCTWGESDAFYYLITTPAEEAELIASEEIGLIEKVPVGKWGGKPSQLRRLRGILSEEPAEMGHHRTRGGKKSVVECDAVDLMAAAAEGLDAADALLDAGGVDLNARDDRKYDVLRYLIDEQSKAAQAKDSVPNEDFKKAQAAKAELLMKLVTRVIGKARDSKVSAAQKKARGRGEL